MKSAIVPIRAERIPAAIYVTSEEKEIIDTYFAERPNLKKGETYKQWILQGIEADMFAGAKR